MLILFRIGDRDGAIEMLDQLKNAAEVIKSDVKLKFLRPPLISQSDRLKYMEKYHWEYAELLVHHRRFFYHGFFVTLSQFDLCVKHYELCLELVKNGACDGDTKNERLCEITLAMSNLHGKYQERQISAFKLYRAAVNYSLSSGDSELLLKAMHDFTTLAIKLKIPSAQSLLEDFIQMAGEKFDKETKYSVWLCLLQVRESRHQFQEVLTELSLYKSSDPVIQKSVQELSNNFKEIVTLIRQVPAVYNEQTPVDQLDCARLILLSASKFTLKEDAFNTMLLQVDNELLKHRPKDYRLLIEMAKLCEQNDRIEDSERLLRRASKVFGLSPIELASVEYHLGNVLDSLDNPFEEVQRHFLAALVHLKNHTSDEAQDLQLSIFENLEFIALKWSLPDLAMEYNAHIMDMKLDNEVHDTVEDSTAEDVMEIYVANQECEVVSDDDDVMIVESLAEPVRTITFRLVGADEDLKIDIALTDSTETLSQVANTIEQAFTAKYACATTVTHFTVDCVSFLDLQTLISDVLSRETTRVEAHCTKSTALSPSNQLCIFCMNIAERHRNDLLERFSKCENSSTLDLSCLLMKTDVIEIVARVYRHHFARWPELDFSKNSLKDEDFKKFFEIIGSQAADSIKSLKLSYCHLSLNVIEKLTNVTALRSLDISGLLSSFIQKPFSDVAAKLFESLDVLAMNRCALGAFELQDELFSCFKNLTKLTIRDNALTADSIFSLFQNGLSGGRLHSLDLSLNDFSLCGSDVWQRMSNLANLTALDLSSCKLANDHITAMCSTQIFRKVDSLTISNNFISSNSSAAELALALPATLTFIDISRNHHLNQPLDSTEFLRIISFKCLSLTHLNISQTHLDAQEIIRTSLPLSLEYLDMSGCLTEAHWKHAYSIEWLSRTIMLLAKLRHFDLSFNFIEAGVCEELEYSWKSSRSLDAAPFVLSHYRYFKLCAK